MKRLTYFEIALGLALGVVLAASVAVIVGQSRRLASSERQRAADLESLRQLTESLRQHKLQQNPVEAGGPTTPVNGDRAALARREATIERLDRELSEARANIAELQAQLSNSSDERGKALASANENHQKEQADWQSQLDNLKQEIDSARADLQDSRQRIAALEADNDKLRSANQQGSAGSPDLERVVANLQDLDRRRDSYLTSILRSYRDITSQFRAMSGMLDSSRDQNSTAFSSAALTRIQNAISLADDDLHQLSELNARTHQLEKQLVKK